MRVRVSGMTVHNVNQASRKSASDIDNTLPSSDFEQGYGCGMRTPGRQTNISGVTFVL